MLNYTRQKELTVERKEWSELKSSREGEVRESEKRNRSAHMWGDGCEKRKDVRKRQGKGEHS